MKRLLLAFASVGLAACATKPVTEERPATPRDIASLVKQTGIAVKLFDGTRIEMGSPFDFGDAYCGGGGCAKKSEIATIIQTRRQADAGSTAAGYGTAALYAVPLAMITAAFAAQSLDHAGDAGSDPVGAPLTPEMRRRIWIDGLEIQNGRVVARRGNTCVNSAQHPTDADAFAWVAENRNTVAGLCLSFASVFMLEHPAEFPQRPAMELWSLAAARNRWDSARCQTPPPISPLAPPLLEVMDRRGDPEFLSIIERTLADEATYANEPDLARTCQGRGGVADRSVWPSGREQVQKAGPFPRAIQP